MIAVACVVVGATGACSSSHPAATGSTAAPVSAGSAGSTKTPGKSCTALVGQPVGADSTAATLGCVDGTATISAPGSFGCAAHGSLYYFPLSDGGFVFGATGGTWAKAPANDSVAGMETAAGC